jgi:hypothetical protein
VLLKELHLSTLHSDQFWNLPVNTYIITRLRLTGTKQKLIYLPWKCNDGNTGEEIASTNNMAQIMLLNKYKHVRFEVLMW